MAGHAPPVQARAPDLVQLHQPDRQPGGRAVEGGGVPARPSSDDHHVEVLCPRCRACSPRCGLLRCHVGFRGNHLHRDVVVRRRRTRRHRPGCPRCLVDTRSISLPVPTRGRTSVGRASRGPSTPGRHHRRRGHVEAPGRQVRQVPVDLLVGHQALGHQPRCRVCSTVARSRTALAGDVTGKWASASTSTSPRRRNSRGRVRPNDRSAPRRPAASGSRSGPGWPAPGPVRARRCRRAAGGPGRRPRRRATRPGAAGRPGSAAIATRSGRWTRSSRAWIRSKGPVGRGSAATSWRRTVTPAGPGRPSRTRRCRWPGPSRSGPTRPASHAATVGPPAPTSQQRHPGPTPVDSEDPEGGGVEQLADGGQPGARLGLPVVEQVAVAVPPGRLRDRSERPHRAPTARRRRSEPERRRTIARRAPGGVGRRSGRATGPGRRWPASGARGHGTTVTLPDAGHRPRRASAVATWAASGCRRRGGSPRR